MKRNSIIKIMIILGALIFSINTAKAVNLKVESKDASENEKVTLGIEITDNTGIVGMDFILHYDQEKLEYVSAKASDIIKDKMNTISNNGEGNIRFVCVGEEIKGNGKIYEVTFNVKSNTEGTSIPVSIDLQDMINDTGDLNVVEIEPGIENGKINVKKQGEVSNTTNVNSKNEEKFDIASIVSGDGNFYIIDSNGKMSIKNDELKGKVKYSSKNEDIAIVDEEGNVTIKSDGEIEVVAELEDGTQREITIDVKKDSNNDNDSDAVDAASGARNTKSTNGVIIFIIVVVIIVILAFVVLKMRNKDAKKREAKK